MKIIIQESSLGDKKIDLELNNYTTYLTQYSNNIVVCKNKVLLIGLDKDWCRINISQNVVIWVSSKKDKDINYLYNKCFRYRNAYDNYYLIDVMNKTIEINYNIPCYNDFLKKIKDIYMLPHQNVLILHKILSNFFLLNKYATKNIKYILNKKKYYKLFYSNDLFTIKKALACNNYKLINYIYK